MPSCPTRAVIDAVVSMSMNGAACTSVVPEGTVTSALHSPAWPGMFWNLRMVTDDGVPPPNRALNFRPLLAVVTPLDERILYRSTNNNRSPTDHALDADAES